ncbi:hypothetical protein A3C91_00020 [Candidatus Azambacteria bacterium RIFCSPHIGHO2_02_FULL_52_12]|uniref:Uncharacterized protein n=1 Tax=Candidatus Azambacteria bacterium RIFCSPLOWO2_01_FULL_46_25 TaxID=1797298 RepID=A0A1F5BUR3_9BACT|nr:MAG: hypothetical protein A3C91_00020 [Candidatus Azambacteria bacterium RIFCSPHIGHO2_02_FULL_52_12]OGD34344.1 MAG: hypothetical protein A2988_02340 [Candidatus Azambacteria bacterium RIFCSPLOWO2_01_FULL_46_25]OGD37378.1 MAG: hypothetical protein A2850_01545 [Candidatus Azambacteria bacterium RIFCSPHIGHO2_01_FULL_51_74]
MSWLKVLQIELAEIKKYIEPAEPVDSKMDIRVGEANDEAMRLYTLRECLSKAGAETAVQARFGGTEEIREQAVAKLHELQEKAETVTHLFWTSIHEQFGHWEKPIGIRRGFEVVIVKQKPPSLMDFLHSL